MNDSNGVEFRTLLQANEHGPPVRRDKSTALLGVTGSGMVVILFRDF